MKLAGLPHQDELHFFAELLGHTGPVSEINVCGRLWTSRVTSHVPLRQVAGLVTAEKILDAGRLFHRTIAKSGIAAPRIAVAGLNPHAGEGGLLGVEEIDIIAPAVQQLRAEGLDAIGPLPADTLFSPPRGAFHGVVTMYHPGTDAMKLMGFDRGVTVAGGSRRHHHHAGARYRLRYRRQERGGSGRDARGLPHRLRNGDVLTTNQSAFPGRKRIARRCVYYRGPSAAPAVIRFRLVSCPGS